MQRTANSQEAAPGQVQTSWCQVRESVETRRPQGTHALRSGPQEVRKRVARLARGHPAAAGSPQRRPRCGGQKQGPQEISDHDGGWDDPEEQDDSKWKHMRLSRTLLWFSELTFWSFPSCVQCQMPVPDGLSEACRWE